MAIFVTTYCEKPHRLSDGAPVGHKCRSIPPEGLLAERRGDLDAFVDALDRRPWKLWGDDQVDDNAPAPESGKLSG